MVKGVPC